MTATRLQRSFTIMRLTLGLVVLIDSVRTLLVSLPGSTHPNVHLVILATVEGLGALLFLVPTWIGVGGIILLCTFAVALLVHMMTGEFPSALLVYAATTLFVMAHGPVHARQSRMRITRPGTT